MKPNGPLFQEVIMRLERFWAQQGCVIWQPYNVKVGAGTMNPATVLRILGPEPWRVAYVEPSVRPADGRYAENPNRWQQFYQYQVILKPDPGDPQEMYLRSLEAIGVDLARHDVRFVEDNWEAPSLGAWGLGWEVWCDGQEISQYTYMQQSGGFICDPVSVELTYGIERIMLFLQGAETFLDIVWDDNITYGDLHYTQEVEQCTYNFEVADVEALADLFRLYEKEALSCLARGLVIPAHDYVLLCSHTFNVLDARGAVGVTERAGYFGRMRALFHKVAVAYVAQRREMDHPLAKRRSWYVEAPPAEDVAPPAPSDGPRPLLLEIGTEELPHDDLQSALSQLREKAPAMLAEARLAHGAIEVDGTPRRLAILVQEVAPRQADESRVVKGPPAQAAFDREGKPTKAAEGFARRHGLPVERLEVAEMDGGRYVVANVTAAGRPAPEALAELLPRLVASIRFGQSMRWNASGVAFSRPIRWFVSLMDGDVIPFEYAGVRSGRVSRGFRTDDPEAITIERADDYRRLLAERGLVLSTEERRRLTLAGASEMARSAGGWMRVPCASSMRVPCASSMRVPCASWLREDEALVAEVADLVEAPRAILGRFDEQYLALPPEVVVTVMRKHQRYFAVEGDAGLMPYFIAVRNGGCDGDDLVRQGNEAVLRARFADAFYFYRKDRERRLEDFLPRLATLTFHERLGSMLDKTRRLEALAPEVGAMLGVAEAELPLLQRAALLCKADLATQLVVEFTSLQGAIGRVYAGEQGEPPAVADAIFEHYLPRSAGDAAPQGQLGLALGLADRLDSIVGLFAAGLEPTGSADPYALRRAAAGVVQNLLAWRLSLDLRRALAAAARLQPVPVPEETLERALDFIAQRLRVHLMEEGIRYDVVDAVLAERRHDPYWAAVSAERLRQWVSRPDWSETLNAYARCRRIVRDIDARALRIIGERYDVRPGDFTEEASRELHRAYLAQRDGLGPGADVDEVMRALVALTPAINRFFAEVLVMAEDPEVRRNRLALVQSVAALTEGVADLSRLEGF